MTEKYEKSTTEIAVGCILSLITTYKVITTVLVQAPQWLDSIVQMYESNESLNRTYANQKYVSPPIAPPELEKLIDSSRSEFKKTLEIDAYAHDHQQTIIVHTTSVGQKWCRKGSCQQCDGVRKVVEEQAEFLKESYK